MSGRIAAGAAFVVLFVMLIAMVFYDSSASFNDWLERWQTLIAGGLAVAAAYLTFWQMRETDDRQQVRHEEMMSLQLRGDMLIISRAAHPQLPVMASACAMVLDAFGKIESALNEMDRIADSATTAMPLVTEWAKEEVKLATAFDQASRGCSEIHESLDKDAFHDAFGLFNAELMASYRLAREYTHIARSNFQHRPEPKYDWGEMVAQGRAITNKQSLEDRSNEINAALWTCVQTTRAFSEQMNDLLHRYQTGRLRP